jgi:two-component system response regulator CpxR
LSRIAKRLASGLRFASNAFMADSILIVDDDKELGAMLGDYLSAEGFQVSHAGDGQAGVDAVAAGEYSLVVMDITMPVMDGFEALRRIRQFSEVPVLMLTARGEEFDRIVGLELGADDYLPKPFNPRELAARLKAILRRARPAAPSSSAALGDLRLDAGTRKLFLHGEPVPVTATEFSIMQVLIADAGSVVDKDRLSREALGRALTPFDRSLDTHVSNLRRKLGNTEGGETRIKTIRGRGYQLISPEAPA